MYFDFEENSGGFLTKIGYKEQKVLDKEEDNTDKVTDNQRQIMKLISENPYITTNSLAKNIGISQRKIKENIAKLKNKKRIARKGSNKGGHWQIIKNNQENVAENSLQKIMKLISVNNKISATQIAETLNITTRTAQRDIEKLKNKNLIKRIGGDKTGSWQIVKNK